MAKLETLISVRLVPNGYLHTVNANGAKRRADAAELIELLRDARRFIMAYKWAIENNPLHTYASALLFTPIGSLARNVFDEEKPQWITIKPSIGYRWSACFQTLEGSRR